jgi:CRISPR-associated protein Csb2
VPALLLTIRFHDGRYHGVPEWPPSPARVFQALVAAAARGGTLPIESKAALEWLEALGAPVVAAPVARKAKGFNNFVPNNDLDAVGGDVRRIDKIRAGKTIRPRLFDTEAPLLYAWAFEASGDDRKHADAICEVAQDLYQLGRGVDMAWAVGEVLTPEECDERISNHRGPVYRPSTRAGGKLLARPQKGSLESLVDRHEKSGVRFTYEKKGRATETLFSQPPKPRFAVVAYDCPSTHLLFDLTGTGSPWRFTQPTMLVTLVRDRAAKRLMDALPEAKACVESVFIGGKDSTNADKAARIRIIPLPSIGFIHADRAIRRVLIEVPPNCPLPVADIEWAFSGLDFSDIDEATGEILIERTLVVAESQKMLGHYGAGGENQSRRWRTVTPAALPESAKRRRIDPARMKEEAKGGAERRIEMESASAAVHNALRHSGINEPIESIRVQREPFTARGARAEAFADGTRFSKHQLWHVETTFVESMAGPFIIGDGRYLGLGLMAPVTNTYRDAFVFDIDASNRPPVGREVEFLRAVRRALMALDRDHGGSKNVSRLFSGHEPNGAPARSGAHKHVFLAATGKENELSKLYVFAPHRADRRVKLDAKGKMRFDAVVENLEIVRAGPLGKFKLTKSFSPLEGDTILTTARKWISETSYSPTRHSKTKSRIESDLIEDVMGECSRRSFPKPEVTIDNIEVGPRLGVSANLRLTFRTAIEGPIIIGRGSHFGLGLFKAADLS